MKTIKIFLFAVLLFASQVFAQKMYLDIGNTRIKDSTGYTTMNRNVLVNGNLFARGYLQLDTSGYGKIFYTGNTLTIQQNKMRILNHHPFTAIPAAAWMTPKGLPIKMQ